MQSSNEVIVSRSYTNMPAVRMPVQPLRNKHVSAWKLANALLIQSYSHLPFPFEGTLCIYLFTLAMEQDKAEKAGPASSSAPSLVREKRHSSKAKAQKAASSLSCDSQSGLSDEQKEALALKRERALAYLRQAGKATRRNTIDLSKIEPESQLRRMDTMAPVRRQSLGVVRNKDGDMMLQNPAITRIISEANSSSDTPFVRGTSGGEDVFLGMGSAVSPKNSGVDGG